MDKDGWILILFGYAAVNLIFWITQKFWSRK